MPFWGLVFTSIGFAVPAVIAYKKRRWVQSASCTIITLTSVAYHGTVHPVAKYIDMTFAHIIGTEWIVRSTLRMIFIRRPTDVILCTMTVGSVLIYFTKSCNNFTNSSKFWHMAFHGLCQGTCYFYLLSN